MDLPGDARAAGHGRYDWPVRARVTKVTLPTDIQEIDHFDGVNLEARIWDAIEARL